LSIDDSTLLELEASLILFYTGVSRSSSTVIAQQSQNLDGDHEQALDAMHRVKKQAREMSMFLSNGDLSGVVDSMKEGWAQKKRTSSAVSNPIIDEIYSSAIGAGALAGKVSGAGGGGFMWFYVPLSQRSSVVSALGKFPGFVSNCHFSDRGAQAWRVI
jgi:D-glycero-alpha-D-manno-heptose-7-phosphate kinase